MLNHTIHILPVAIALLVFMSPCQLPFLGSLLLTTCSSPSTYFVLIRIGLALLEFLVVTHLLVSELPYGLFMLLGGILTLWDAFQKTVVNYGSEIVILKYRKMQVLEKLVNSCLQSRVFPIMAMVSPIAQIFTGFAIVEFHSSMDLSHMVSMLVFLAGSSLVNLSVFAGAGSICCKSLKWLKAAKNCHMTNKVQKRAIKSMTPLRIFFGSNYVDVLTPLVVQNFCLNQTLSLLLLS